MQGRSRAVHGQSRSRHPGRIEHALVRSNVTLHLRRDHSAIWTIERRLRDHLRNGGRAHPRLGGTAVIFHQAKAATILRTGLPPSTAPDERCRLRRWRAQQLDVARGSCPTGRAPSPPARRRCLDARARRSRVGAAQLALTLPRISTGRAEIGPDRHVAGDQSAFPVSRANRRGQRLTASWGLPDGGSRSDAARLYRPRGFVRKPLWGRVTTESQSITLARASRAAGSRWRTAARREPARTARSAGTPPRRSRSHPRQGRR